MPDTFDDINPRPRLLMGPGPINADPRVLRAMSAQLLGQFDPQFTDYMNELMAMYRRVFQTGNRWTFTVDGTARAAIEAVLVSVLEPGDRVLVPIFGRFGHLLVEIAERVGAEIHTIETEWGSVFAPERIEAAVREHRPKLVAICHGDTSTTMAQPLADIGPLCRRHGALLYVDATATLGGMNLPVDAWQIDAVSAGLQKCLAGPSGSAPLTINTAVEKVVARRRQIERGIRTQADIKGDGTPIRSNYFDLAMLMDYWSERRLNHHTEATTMLYGARECARILLKEGLSDAFARHEQASRAMVAGLCAMRLELFGDLEHKMHNVTGIVIPPGVDGERVRTALREDFNIEIGTSFGPLYGKIWRIGTMGYNCRKDAVLITLSALETVLAGEGLKVTRGAAVDAARMVYADQA